MSEKAVAPEAFTGLMLASTLPANDQPQGRSPLVAMAGNATDYEECLACQ